VNGGKRSQTGVGGRGVGAEWRQQIQTIALRIHGAGNVYQGLCTAQIPRRCTINVNFLLPFSSEHK